VQAQARLRHVQAASVSPAFNRSSASLAVIAAVERDADLTILARLARLALARLLAA
jgi:hypothetical protein